MSALAGEVTSTHHETDTGPKLRTCAAVGVPVHVLIDRNTMTAHCYTDLMLPGEDPTQAYYASETKVDLGEPLALPAPYPTLDTAPFRETTEQRAQAGRPPYVHVPRECPARPRAGHRISHRFHTGHSFPLHPMFT